MLKKRFTTVIVALAVAVAIPCTAFAGELDAEAAAPTTSIGENASNSAATANVSNIASNAVENENSDRPNTVGENTVADNNDVQDLRTGAPANSENQQNKTETTTEPTTEPTAEEQQPVDAPESTRSEQQTGPIEATEQAAPENTVEQEVITDEPATEETIVVDILEEAVPLEEAPAIVEELPIESTLVIHHLFQYGDIVCDDYETITDLTAGDSICIGEYNYEDDYIFVDCLNEDEMFTLAEGENEVILNYTLKDGYRMAE